MWAFSRKWQITSWCLLWQCKIRVVLCRVYSHVIDFASTHFLNLFPLFLTFCFGFFCHREQPIFSTKAHVFQIDPETKKNWLPASKVAVNVSYYYDSTRNTYRIISVDGSKVCSSAVDISWVCMFVCVHMCMYVCVCACACAYCVYLHLCLRVYLHLCGRGRLLLDGWVCIQCVCMCVCMCMCVLWDAHCSLQHQ